MAAKYFSREEAQRITQRALSFSMAEQARVTLQSSTEGNTRFAGNQFSTGGDSSNAELSVSSAFGRRVASATTNRFDDDSLKRVLETSERLARLVPEDPEYLGELGPQEYSHASSLSQRTANLAPQERAKAVETVTGPAAAKNLEATGFLVHATGSSAVATSKGLFAYDAESRATFTTTVRTPDGTGSGWAGMGVNDWGDMDVARLGTTAIEKAERSRNARAVEPGRWTVVLEPNAVASMVGLMMGALNARNADEGRSFFSKEGGGNKIGDKVVDERINIHSDPADPLLYSGAFGGDGQPNRRTVWFDKGVTRNLIYNRFWAEKQGRQPTGFPAGYMMQGGNASLDELVRGTQRGLLVTRFWYIRPVDPRTILFTGLTRDGTFLIENGRITGAVKNLRWNESPIFMLNNVEAMGRPVRVAPGESGGLGPSVIVPPLRVRDFTFTSLSDAV